jgi:hypothetical protein
MIFIIAFNQLANILDSTGHLYNTKRDSNNNQQLSKLAKSLFQLRGKKALKLSSFYALPKMHKSPVVGRPVFIQLRIMLQNIFIINYIQS